MSILRKIFGPSKEEVWRQLCSEIGADFIEGGLWRGDKVEARVGEWTITLDTFVVSTGKTSIPFTRLRVPYINKDGFRFRIYRKSMFSGLGKLFGMQDIDVGHADFDREFIIQGNDAQKVQLLFGNSEIRRRIEDQPAVHLEVKDDEGWFGTAFPEGVDELYFQVVGVIKDVERLKALYELFAETLNHLCHIGSAYEDDPRLALK
ncbi:MAG: DUF3137 domain-containing protein [Acidobacteriota bacterium]